MAQGKNRSFKARLNFDELKPDEKSPQVAVYEVDAVGGAVRKLGRSEQGQLEVNEEWSKLGIVALGPDVEDISTLTRESLVTYRVQSSIAAWREGITLGRNLWERFLFGTVCVHGEAAKCRPWWWDIVVRLDTVADLPLQLSKSLAMKPVAESLASPLLIPSHCVPLCDGIVEVYERVCCCRRWRIPDILDRLRELLRVIPIPLPDPPPWGPIGPWPGPDPGPYLPHDLGRLVDLPSPTPQSAMSIGLRARAADIRRRLATAPVAMAGMPSERLYDDYVALSKMDLEQADAYVLERPYLIGMVCTCHQRKLGETPLQPGGRFDFCYRRPRVLPPIGMTCRTSYAYRVRQLVQGSWVTVYDGIAAHDWFAQGESADLHTSDWRAKVCGSGPGDPPPTDGALPFALLEYVGSAGTRHRKFPAQSAHTQMPALAVDSGTYDTGYAPDCPWGGSLGLRIWFSPDLQPVAKYYRLSVFAVGDDGIAVGSPTILDAAVSWDRWVQVGPDWVTTSELLSTNPADVGGLQGLIRIPYWSGGNFWLSSQYHQVWRTPLFAPGKYMLLLELFDAAAAKIKPNGSPAGDPGAAKAFQFRRWRFSDPTATDNVAFSDAAHVFWIDNSPVQGDIVDIRKGGVPNTEECQFLSGPPGTGVSVGFRAYHSRGVSDPANTFMMDYSLSWTRGLNGPSGLFASGTSDVGEPPNPAAESNVITIGDLLGPWPGYPTSHSKCTFALHLAVHAKHFTGSSRILEYDYHELASFAAATP